jgi:hypothetical protein
VSLGLSLLDSILQALVWLSAGYVSRATVLVIWKVFCGVMFGFPAGNVSWGCLHVICMEFHFLLYCVYLFIDIWISSRGRPYPTCISYLFHINLILFVIQWVVHHYEWPVRLIRWKLEYGGLHQACLAECR